MSSVTNDGLIDVVDFLLGVGGRQTDPENKKDLLQESHADGDRMVRLQLRRRTEHKDIGVSPSFFICTSGCYQRTLGECFTHKTQTCFPAAISTRSIMPSPTRWPSSSRGSPPLCLALWWDSSAGGSSLWWS